MPVVEIFPDGQWVNITADHKAEAGLSTGRGRKNAADTTSSHLDMVWKNPAGRYSSDRPGTPYYRKLGRGTPIRITEPLLRDGFTRSVSNGWGSTETNSADPLPLPTAAWTNGSGSASDYSVTAGVGRHTLTTTGTARQSRVDALYRHSVVTCSVTVGAVATVASARASIVARKNTAGTCHYRAELEFTTAGTVDARIIRLAGSGDATLVTASGIGVYGAGSKWWLQFTAVGPQLYLRAWPDGSTELSTATCSTEDDDFRKGQIALRSVRDTGNTNSNLTVDFDALTVAHPDFFGEILSMRPMSAQGGADLTMTVQASGVLQKLRNTDKPIRSALYRVITGGVAGFGDDPPIGYWPLEDGRLATQLEAVSAQPGYFFDNVSFGSDSGLGGSAPLPSVPSGAFVAGSVPAFPSTFNAATDYWSINFFAKIDQAPTVETVFARFGTVENATCYEVAVNPTGEIVFRTPKLFQLILANFQFSVSTAYNTTHSTRFGKWVEFTIFNTPAGGANYQVNIQFVAVDNQFSAGASSPTGTTVWQPPNGGWQLYGPAEGSWSYGHVAVHPQLFVLNAFEAVGYVSERARTRLSRFAGEENLTVQTVGIGSEKMGPQLLATVAKNLEDCASTDLGIMSESRHLLGLEYKAHQHLYNQWPHAIVDVSAHQLTDGLDPVRDDQRGLANQVTATRSGGTPQTFTIPDGDVFHLTTEDPPAGIGTVAGTMSPNVEVDRQAHQQAAWRTHQGASRVPRYEQLLIKLHAPPYLGNAQLTADVRALAEGDVIRIVDVPTTIEQALPPGPRELIVQGYEQFRDGVVDQITFTCTPADDWRVWCMDSGGSRIEVAADSDDTSLKVSTTLGPPWRDAPDPGWSVQGMTGGEALYVTGSSTDTPVAGNVGTIATGNNASIVPAFPASITPDIGTSLFILAAIRNSGTGVPNQPAGWATVLNNGNMKLFHKYYVTGDTAPTITFTGGVVNADTMARCFAFTGVTREYGGAFGSAKVLKRTPGSSDMLNSSAQNVAYPAYFVHRANCVVLIIAWKQDDATGYAPPAGFTEIVDNSTTTGDDASIAAYYQIQTTATDIPAGSIVVTGGASAISRSSIVALRPFQTFTVERSVNGVVGSLAAGETIHVWNHGAVPL